MSVMNSKKTKKKYRYMKRKNVRTMKRIRNIRKKKRKKKTRKKKKIKGGFVDLPTGLSSLMYPGAVGSLYVFFLSMISNKPELNMNGTLFPVGKISDDVMTNPNNRVVFGYARIGEELRNR